MRLGGRGLTGLAFAVGLGGPAISAACGAALALRYGADARAAAPPLWPGTFGRDACGLLVNVGPERWMHTARDAIAMNLTCAVIVGGLGLALAASLRSENATMRIAAIAAAGVATLAIFVAGEPRCLAGPYAMMDRAVWPVWLDHVPEMQPLMRLFRTSPMIAAAVTAFPAVALVAVVALARDRELRRDFAFLAVAATLVLGAVTTMVAFKAFSYAIWFAMPLVALALVRLLAALRMTSVAARVIAGLVLTPTALSAGAILVADAAGLHDTDVRTPAENACFASASYQALARLSPGVVVTNVRYGPYVLALTPHSAQAAPYHRLSGPILANHRALAARPEEARAVLAGAQATYVVVCRDGYPLGFGATERRESLWARLQAGAVPDWLEPVAATAGQPLLAFRLKP